jgi:acyl-coenzyme A synthetase/AMP-(fatty) acid ligase
VNAETNAAHLAEIAAAVSPRLTLFENAQDLAGAALPLDDFLDGLPDDAGDDETPAVCDGDDPAVIFYTSGTEAKPKGVIYSHATLYHNFDSVADMLGLRADDRVLDFRALSWISAQQLGLGAPLLRGATAVVAEGFSRTRYLEWIRDFEIDIAACVPAGIAMLLSEPVTLRGADVPKLRFITSSSAPLLVEQWRAFEELYAIAIAQGYGMSEAGWITGSRGGDRRHGTVGRPVKHQRVRILDGDGHPLAPGETGEIEASGGRQQSLGYLLADGTVRRAPADGVRTGDLGFLDADGYLHVTGRAKELIIRGGVNIAPLEIDGVISELAGIAEACTVGVPDPIYGEEVVSYVALKAGSDLSREAIRAHCAARLPELKTPKEIIIRDALPRTPRGKLDRNTLAETWRPANDT